MQITVNEPGARTIADSRPMLVEGQNVYVTVGAGTASLFIGGRIVATQDAETMSNRGAQDWAVAYLAEAEAIDAQPHTTEDYSVEETARTVRLFADRLIGEADKLAAYGDAPHTIRNSWGRKVTFTADDPRHPSRAAAAYRKEAGVYASWTAADEFSFKRYVDNGMADTDGYFVPLSRSAWKLTLGA